LVRRHRGRAIAATVTVLALAAGPALWAAAQGRDSGGAHGRDDGGVGARSRTPGRAPGTGTDTGTRTGTGTTRTASVFGPDPRTADPCALAAPAALRRYGDVHLDPAYGSYARCDVIVTRRGDPDTDVEFQFVARDPSARFAAPGRASGRISLVKEGGADTGSGECTRDVLIGGEPAFAAVTAKPVDSSEVVPAATLCAMADAGAGHSFSVLAALPPGAVLARRSPPLPADSLAQVDACTLLTGHALEAVPGVDATHPDIDFGHWACSWASTTGDTWLKIRYDRGPEPTADDGTPTRLAGRPAFVTATTDDHTTSVTLVHRAFAAQGGGTEAETVLLDYGGPDAGDTRHRVTVATALATSVATALPPP
jgi:hypothetical protein